MSIQVKDANDATVTIDTVDDLMVVVGAKTDAASPATDATPISEVSILKQISKSIQAAAESLAGTLEVATLAVTQSGSWVLSAGAALIGKVGIDQTTPGSTNAVTLVPGGSGGWSKWSTPKNNGNAPLTATVASVKNAAGVFGGYFISNPNAAVACVQVFDAASPGAVTLGTTRPDLVFPIPPNSAANFELANGAAMASGIQIAASTTASGNAAPSTGLDVTILFK